MHYHYHGATLSHNEQRTSFLLKIRHLILSVVRGRAGEEDRQKATPL